MLTDCDQTQNSQHEVQSSWLSPKYIQTKTVCTNLHKNPSFASNFIHSESNRSSSTNVRTRLVRQRQNQEPRDSIEGSLCTSVGESYKESVNRQLCMDNGLPSAGCVTWLSSSGGSLCPLSESNGFCDAQSCLLFSSVVHKVSTQQWRGNSVCISLSFLCEKVMTKSSNSLTRGSGSSWFPWSSNIAAAKMKKILRICELNFSCRSRYGDWNPEKVLPKYARRNRRLKFVKIEVDSSVFVQFCCVNSMSDKL